jgi:uncharacterized protein (UPF0332 family)
MSEEETLKKVIRYWIEKAEDSLNAAYDELKAGRLSFSVNRIYYACFYAVSAVLFQERLRFKKHSGVRAAFHKYLVKPGLVSREFGQFYDELFEARQRGDYIELVSFEKQQAEDWLRKARQFVEAMKLLIKSIAE